MARLVRVLFVLGILALASAGPAGAQDEGAALRGAARAFGQGLLAKDAGALRKVLPQGGKVRLALSRFGPEDGAFAPGQVEAVFRDFLGKGSVKAFEVAGVQGDGRAHGTAHARVSLVDREGRPARVTLYLTFQLEDGRWVVRGLEESAG